MKLVKLNAFDRILIDKYKTGDCLIHSTLNPKFFSIAYWIQFISAPIKVTLPVAEHIATIVMINGIPHVQSTLKSEETIQGWIKKKLKINYLIKTIPLVGYLKLYDSAVTNIYYCPLSEKVREVFDETEHQNRIDMIEGGEYESVWRFIKTGIDDDHIDRLEKFLKMLPFYKKWIPGVLKWVFRNNESASRFTCSAAVSFKAAETYLEHFNYSEDTPQDIVEKKIYEDKNYLIQGRKQIQLYHFNSTEVALIEKE